MTPARIERAELHALVDGELNPERRREIESYLKTHPEDAALVETWRRQAAALRAALDHVAHEPAPAALRPTRAAAQGPIETGAIHWGRPSASGRSTRRLDEVRKTRRQKALASALLTLVGAAIVAAIVAFVFVASPKTEGPLPVAEEPQGFSGRAESAYRTYVQDPRAVEIDAGRKGDLAAWLLRRVGFGLIPDLSQLGWRFLGGRVIPGLREPAGLLIYEKDGGDRLALYFERAANGSPPLLGPRRGALSAIEWRAAGMAFVLLGPVGPELLEAAGERAAAEAIAPQATPSLQAIPRSGGQ
jgi:anti-sigma factor RsiW